MPKGIYIRSKEHNKKISDAMKKHPSNRLGKKGYRFTEEHKKNMSIAKKRENLSKETRIKLSDAIRGDKNPNWKGGLCTREKKQYFDINYKLWREEVFKRDKYTCQKCGVKGVYLTAHHVKSWKNYPLLRYKIDNGKTLCGECHKQTDNYKGRVGYNSKL